MKLSHIGLAVLAMAVWGCNFVAISLGLTELPPFLFTGLRFVATVVPFIFFVRKPDVSWKLIFAVGFFLLTLQFTFLFKGMQMGVGGGIASTVIQCQAFFTLICGAILLREVPTMRDISGLAVAAFGIALIGFSMGKASLAGLLTVVLAGFCWALGNIFLKRVGKADMLALIIYASVVPPIPLLLLSYFVEGPEKISKAFETFSVVSGFSLAYIVLASTLFSYTVWGFLMKNYESRQVAPFGLLVPIFGIFSGWLVMDEAFGAQKIGGAVLVILGLIVVNWRALAPFIKRALDKKDKVGG